MSIVGAIHSFINNQSDITDELSKYDFGSGDSPAIFTISPAPENAATPLIVINQVSSSGGVGDRGNKSGIYNIDIQLWEKKGRSEASVRELADVIWFTLNRATLTDDYFEIVYCIADVPYRLLDPDGFVGFNISVRVLVRKGV